MLEDSAVTGCGADTGAELEGRLGRVALIIGGRLLVGVSATCAVAASLGELHFQQVSNESSWLSPHFWHFHMAFPFDAEVSV